MNAAENENIEEILNDHEGDDNSANAEVVGLDAGNDASYIPYILRSYFKLVGEVVNSKAEGKCLTCKETFTGNLKALSGLKRHLVASINRSCFIRANFSKCF